MTPEGKTKLRVKKLLAAHGAYWFMPVQNGLGAAGLDFHGCYKGRAFFIETKAGNKGPTPRQKHTMQTIEAAGGVCFLINDVTGLDMLERWLT